MNTCSTIPCSQRRQDITSDFSRIFGFLALTLACLAAPRLNAADITGSVLNKENQVYLERAYVELLDTPFQTLTEKDGTFRFPNLPDGTYTLIADYTGLDPQTKTITITKGESVKVSFELRSGVYVLDTVRVVTKAQGRYNAINLQHNADSHRSVSSVDAYGEQVSSNPGEFLRHMPGVQLDITGAEVNSVGVRGLDSNLTEVTMDGNQIASTSGGSANRSVSLSPLSLGTIENVEVIKAALPNMSANMVGGAVNFNTRSALATKGRRIQLMAGLTANSQQLTLKKTATAGNGDPGTYKLMPSFKLDFSDTFLDNRLGITANLLYEKQWIASSATINAVGFVGLPDPARNPRRPTDLYFPDPPEGYTIYNTRIRRTTLEMDSGENTSNRMGLSINTDYRLSERTTLTLKTAYTVFKATNRDHVATITPGGLSTLANDWSPTLFTTSAASLAQSASMGDSTTKTLTLSPQIRFKSDNWDIGVNCGYSRATSQRSVGDNFSNANVKLTGLDLTMETPLDSELPARITQNSGPNLYSLSSYRVNQSVLTNGVQTYRSSGFVEAKEAFATDQRYSGALDITRSFTVRYPFSISSGISVSRKERDKSSPGRRWSWVGPDGIYGTADDVGPDGRADTADDNTNFDLGIFAEPVPVKYDLGGLPPPTAISTKKVYEYYKANPQAFKLNEAYTFQQQLTSKQKIFEDIKAAYLMCKFTFMKFTALPGVRIEQTNIKSRGARLDRRIPIPPGQVQDSIEWLADHYFVTTRYASYRTPALKYLHLKYELNRTLQSRASYTETIGRPNFAEVIPNDVYDPAAQRNNVQTRAPLATYIPAALRPESVKNFDVSLEFYPKNAGAWSVSWFHKRITDKLQLVYLGESVSGLTDTALMEQWHIPENLFGYYITVKTNSGYATWSGFEIDVTQKLKDYTFIPQFLHGFSGFANYTRVYEMDGSFGIKDGKITRLNGVAEHIFNGGIQYQSPKGRFTAEISTNYQSEIPYTSLPYTSRSTARNEPNQDQYDRWTKAFQTWNASTTFRISPRIRLVGTARNVFNERKTSTTAGLVQSRADDNGVFYKLSATIDL